VSGAGGRSFACHTASDRRRSAYRGELFTVDDVGYLDTNGLLFIVDRKSSKDMVIPGGVNIYVAEVEAVRHGHPDAVDVAVLGVPDHTMGEQVQAIVETRRGGVRTAGEIIAFCREKMAHYKCPRSVDLVTELPRDPNGKVRTRELRERYRAACQNRV
jgi:long-chain acyl-CoA synthetase